MPENASPAYAVIHAVYLMSTPFVYAYLPVWFFWYRAVKGTRLRYVLSSILGPVIIGNVVFGASALVVNTVQQRWLLVPIDVFIVVMYYRMYYRDKDDDNFWTSMGRKIKARARSLRTARSVSVVSVPLN